MKVLKFPVNQGIDFEVEITENAGVVEVPAFVFRLHGTAYNIEGGSFEMSGGDVLMITPDGLELCEFTQDGNDAAQGTVAPPASVFAETNTAYWLVARDVQTGGFSRLEVAE